MLFARKVCRGIFYYYYQIDVMTDVVKKKQDFSRFVTSSFLFSSIFWTSCDYSGTWEAIGRTRTENRFAPSLNPPLPWYFLTFGPWESHGTAIQIAKPFRCKPFFFSSATTNSTMATIVTTEKSTIHISSCTACHKSIYASTTVLTVTFNLLFGVCVLTMLWLQQSLRRKRPNPNWKLVCLLLFFLLEIV